MLKRSWFFDWQGKGVWLCVIFECENPTQNDLMIWLGLLWLTCMRFGLIHFLIQPLRQSEKWIRALVLFGSLLSLGFRFSIFIKCWDPYVNPGCKVQLGFCGRLYFLLQHVDLVPSSYGAWLQFYNSISVSPGFCKGSMIKYVGSLISFLDSLLYPGCLFW